ncbi:hypothetical protein ABZT17_34965 [Streptomyces sp. NPDC005648]|uniref:hypothetical protein n=1 Tax=Streptomyces sp. NPDC005648 TaxID=3157044 RepID=UPI0033A0DF89
MPFPAGVETVTVSSGQPLKLPDGTAIQGTLYFSGPDVVTIAGEDVLLGGEVPPVELVDGSFSVDLVATDATGMSPTGWTYTVRAVLTNAASWIRYISLPKATPSVKLSDVVVPDPVAGSFSTLIDATAVSAAYLAKAANLADVPDKAAGRTHLGLGGAAVLDVGTGADTVAAGDDPRFGQSKPWVFDITDPAFGAVGDAKIVTDGAVTAGVPVVNCNTSAPFHSGLVGKSVLIHGAGPTGVTEFVTTFSSYNSPTSMGLTAAPPTSATGAIVIFGTNNYTAIRAANAAATAYRAAGHPYSEVYTPPTGGFILDGPLDTSKSGNGQVVFGPDATTGGKKVPHFRSDGSGAGVRHWEQLVPQISGGTWISFGFYSSTSAQLSDINANGNPGIISGPNEGASNGLAYGVGGRFSNTMPMISNMAFLVPHSAYGLTRGAWNFFGCANAHIRDVSVSTIGVVPSSTDYTSPGVFGTGLSIGCLMPAPGNNDLSIVDNLSIQGGFTYAIFFSEHTLIGRIMALYAWAGLCPVGTYAGSVGAAHSMRVLSASVEACQHEVYIIGPGSNGDGPIVDIQLSTESSTPNIDGNGVGALMAAVGTLTLTGLYNPAGVSIAHPTGIQIINGQAPRAISRKTGAFTAGPLDRTLVCDTSSGAFTGTLPDADVNPVEYIFRNVGANTLTVAAFSGQLITGVGSTSGTATVAVASGQSLRVQALYNGTAWGWYAV